MEGVEGWRNVTVTYLDILAAGMGRLMPPGGGSAPILSDGGGGYRNPVLIQSRSVM